MTKPRPMPIGIQTFADIITRRFAYVDKTAFVYKLATEGKCYFLSRPRRFGKSLFLSTLESYFLGKKELFKGLALEKLEEDGAKEEEREAWQVYPIFYLDFNAKKYDQKDSLYKILNDFLEPLENEYGIIPKFPDVDLRFKNLLQKAYEKIGKQVVVLVDEYDKPLLETLENDEIFQDNRATMKAFFSNLKKQDKYIRFAFLTGVTKFSQVSIFSDLNNLRDISMDEDFNAICGISEDELINNFENEITSLAEKNKITKDECIAKLKKNYDGYHFYQNTKGVYNPFSLLNTFASGDFKYYWFKTGSPNYFNKDIEKNHFDVKRFVEGISLKKDGFSEYHYENQNFITLMYQTGYLTISDYNEAEDKYILQFPNEEIKYRFLEEFFPIILNINYTRVHSCIVDFIKDIRECKVDDFMTRLQSILASIPYCTSDDKSKITEYTLHSSIYIIFCLMGQFTQSEVHTSKGRADSVVWTRDAIYVFEFKLNGTSQEALTQIEDKSYSISYKADGRKIVKIGVGFEKDTTNIKDWIVNENN